MGGEDQAALRRSRLIPPYAVFRMVKVATIGTDEVGRTVGNGDAQLLIKAVNRQVGPDIDGVAQDI